MSDIEEHLKAIATPLHLACYTTRNERDPKNRMLPVPHIVKLNEMVMRAIADQEHQNFLNVMISVRCGKALDIDTPIPTPTGWRKMLELQAGDEVYDERGLPCRVLDAFEPYWSDECREVSFSDGSTMVADGPHTWTAYSYAEQQALGAHRRYHGIPHREWPENWALTEGGEGPSVRTTDEMRTARYYIPTCQPAESWSMEDLLPPYTLGAWLGDGSSGEPHITLNRLDADDIEARINQEGIKTHRVPSGERPGSVLIRMEDARWRLTAMGLLGDKRLPSNYLRGSIEQRRALLAGLMDTDGGIENEYGRASFTSQIKNLADGVWELLCSLGAVPHRDQRPAKLSGRETGETAYRITVSCPFNPFHTARKAGGWTDGKKGGITRRTRVVTGVTDAASRFVRCIRVDSPSHLYLASESWIPTHNSLFMSRSLPFWFLGMFPDRQVILVSYNETFAASWGAKVKELMAFWGPRLFGQTIDPRTSSKTEWSLKGHPTGGMRSVGINGTLTGIGGDLIVIDDPIKNPEQANSATERVKLLEWYDSALRTRLEPGGTLALTMARWHADDLSGALLAREAEMDHGDHWDVLRCPMRAVAPDNADAEWRDELGRADGGLLWPERFPEDVVRSLEESNPNTWNALYQQDPTPGSGGMFDPDNWVFKPGSTGGSRKVRTWDTAATEGGGDWTVGARCSLDSNGVFYIEEILRDRLHASAVEERLKLTARKDGVGMPVRIERGKAGDGKALGSHYVRMLLGFDVACDPPSGSKTARATPLSAQQGIKNVVICGDEDEPWVKLLVEEFRMFPKARHDDQVDAVSLAFEFLASSGETSMVTDELLEMPLVRTWENSLGLGMGPTEGGRSPWDQEPNALDAFFGRDVPEESGPWSR